MDLNLQELSCGSRCDDCLVLTSSCLNVFERCPCYTLDKCIRVCSNTTNTPVTGPSANCHPVTTPSTQCVSCGDAATRCCDNVSVCLVSGDKLSANYTVTAKPSGRAKVFIFDLKICNKCQKCIDVLDVTTIVQENSVSGWKDIADTMNVISNFGNIEPGKCHTVSLTGSIDTTLITAGLSYRISVKVQSCSGSSSIYVPLTTLQCSTCESSANVCLFEVDDQTLNPITTPSCTVDGDLVWNICDQVYETPCSAVINNQVALLTSAGNCSTTSIPLPTPADCETPVVLSNVTAINSTCSTPTATLAGIFNCSENANWTLTKTSDLVKYNNDLYGIYEINVTRIPLSSSCNLDWNVTIDVGCVSYRKRFTYSLIYDRDQVQTSIITDKEFFVGPVISGGSFTDSGSFAGLEVGGNLTIQVTYTNDTYNLSNCSLFVGNTGTVINETVVPTTGTSCSTEVKVSDDLLTGQVTAPIVETQIQCGDLIISAPSPNISAIQNLINGFDPVPFMNNNQVIFKYSLGPLSPLTSEGTIPSQICNTGKLNVEKNCGGVISTVYNEDKDCISTLNVPSCTPILTPSLISVKKEQQFIKKAVPVTYSQNKVVTKPINTIRSFRSKK